MSKDPEGKKVPLVKEPVDSEVPRTNTGVKIDDPKKMKKSAKE